MWKRGRIDETTRTRFPKRIRRENGVAPPYTSFSPSWRIDVKLFFTIVAGIVVGFLLVVVIAYLLIRFWLRRALKKFADLAGGAFKGIAPFMLPLRITLEPGDPSQWMNKAAVNRLLKSFLAAGFQEVGPFTIEEFPVMRLQAFVQPEQSVYALVCEHPDK